MFWAGSFAFAGFYVLAMISTSSMPRIGRTTLETARPWIEARRPKSATPKDFEDRRSLPAETDVDGLGPRIGVFDLVRDPRKTMRQQKDRSEGRPPCRRLLLRSHPAKSNEVPVGNVSSRLL